MINALLSVPTLIGALVFMTLTTVVGMTTYYVTFQLHSKRQSVEAIKEVRDAMSNLFRVVGWLFTLLLPLTFTDVLGELTATESAIESEAAAIEDVNHNLLRFGTAEAGETRQLLFEYTQAVVRENLAGSRP